MDSSKLEPKEETVLSSVGLNVNAVEFVPRFDAAPFVPGQKTHNIASADAEKTPDAASDTPPKETQNGVEPLEPQEELGLSPEKEEETISPPPPVQMEQQTESWEANAEEEKLSDEDSQSTSDEIVKKGKPPEAAVKTKKEYVNVVFIGHVDAGKSTIGGHIMKLTGMVDERTLAKYEREAKEKNRESWYLSWTLDTNQEERDKGKTVEVGRAYFETEKRHFTILDAPGHKSFVPNMIGGASQADLAVLVISARRGEFETGFERGGQTREHAMLVKTAGVKHLVILVNKMDDSTVCWDEARFKEIKEGLTPYLKKVGFNPKLDITYIPCSGITGAFLKDPPSPSICDWYSGQTFIEYLDDLPPISRRRDAPVRIIIVDKYNDMGTIVLGKVESGIVTKGQSLLLLPNRTTVTVLQLWSDDEETEEITPGENVKVKLKGVEEDQILSGFVLCPHDDVCHVGKIFDAQVIVVEQPSSSIICPGYSAVLHMHSAVEEVTVIKLICKVDKKTNEKVKPLGALRFIKQGDHAIIRLESAELFCLEAYNDFQQMGRFTLRDEGRTVAQGKVLKVVE